MGGLTWVAPRRSRAVPGSCAHSPAGGTGCTLRAQRGARGSNRHRGSRPRGGASTGGVGDAACHLQPRGRAHFGPFHVTAEHDAREMLRRSTAQTEPRTNKAAFSQRLQSPGFLRQIPTLRVSARQTPASPRAGGGRREALPDPSQAPGGGQRCPARRGTAKHVAERHSGEEKENQRGSACFASPAAAPQPPACPHSDGPRGKGRAELAKEPRVPSSPDPAAHVPPRGTSPQGRVTHPPARPPVPRPGNGGLSPPQSTEPQWHPRYRRGN